jgi:nucleoside-diphosphate-sugar epimerase
VRVFLTGGAGFVGRRVVAGLLARGETVVAAVRDPDRASDLRTAGATVVADDLSDAARLADQMQGADTTIHIAGAYRVGIPASERAAMWDANVGTTTRILESAETARTARIVYVSTVNAFGNTRRKVADESWQRDLATGFLSWYDETKYRAHEVAEERIRAGAPIVIVMPSQVYGPGDHSGFGEQMRLANEGRLPYRALDGVGVGLVHVDDLAAGILAALDRGRIGESYVLSGPRTTLGEAVTLAAALAGRRPPRLRLPTGLLRVMAPFGRIIGQPNIRELISASEGVTYWATSDKAERELGFRPRSIETGLRDTFGAR